MSRRARITEISVKEGAQATIGQALARVSSPEADVTLVSPRDGEVQDVTAETGDIIAPGEPIATIVDLTDLNMTVFLPAADAGKLAIGDEARVILDAAPDYVIPAVVSFVASDTRVSPKAVETKEERAKQMFRVNLRIDPQVVKTYGGKVEPGLPGAGFVRTKPDVKWPPELQIKLPPTPVAQAPPPPAAPAARAHAEAAPLEHFEDGAVAAQDFGDQFVQTCLTRKWLRIRAAPAPCPGMDLAGVGTGRGLDGDAALEGRLGLRRAGRGRRFAGGRASRGSDGRRAASGQMWGPADNEASREVDGGGGRCLLGFDLGERLRSAVALVVKDGGSDGFGGGAGSKAPQSGRGSLGHRVCSSCQGGIGPALRHLAKCANGASQHGRRSENKERARRGGLTEKMA